MTGPTGGSGGGGGSTAPAPVATIDITPATASLLTGVADSGRLGTVALTATPRDASGNALTGRSVSWSSSADSVATVNSAGVVKAVGAGSVTMTATSDGKTAQVPITVTRAQVASIVVTPLTSSVKIGESETLSVKLADSLGNELTGNRLIVEFNNDPSLVTVLGGRVTGVAAGIATINYTSENNSSAVATVTVLQ